MSGTAIFLLLGLQCAFRVHSADWGYGPTKNTSEGVIYGPADWYKTHPGCNESKIAQSPINILEWTQDQALGAVVFNNYSKVPQAGYVMQNNGHSVELDSADKTVSVTGGGLIYRYVLQQFHFHWGPNNSQGSEHRVNNVSHPLEIHLVHYNAEKYETFSAAVASINDSTAVAVIAIFVDEQKEKSQKTCQQLGDLTQQFKDVPDEGNTSHVNGFAVQDLLPTSRSYFRYNGSLTTPDCNQIVVWTVFTQPIYLTNTEIEAFRNFRSDDSERLEMNFRRTQQIDGRTILYFSTGHRAGGGPLLPITIASFLLYIII